VSSPSRRGETDRQQAARKSAEDKEAELFRSGGRLASDAGIPDFSDEELDAFGSSRRSRVGVIQARLRGRQRGIQEAQGAPGRAQTILTQRPGRTLLG